MCGVAGIVCLWDDACAPSLEQLGVMVGALAHRGPDAFGVYRDPHAGLGHARLSIIDLERGQQPLANENDTLWVSFNGEIFNYIELRKELVALGHRFRTASDTEVIVHAWEAWGTGAFERFNGQYALAIWDATHRRLVLARDPLGIQPLYLREHRGRLYFASEIKALFAAEPSLPREFDPRGLAQCFTFWSVVPPQGIFAGIEELRPGTARIYERGSVRDVIHYHPRYPTVRFGGSIEDATAAVRDELERATRLRMLRADVPVGCYVSGGLDSALVAALARAATGGRFATFSLRFEDAEYDETPYQRMMVRELGSEHHEVMVNGRHIAEVFPDVIEHTERPVLRTAAAPLFLLSRLVRGAGIKVVLTGEGADEMFAGYDLFREGKVRRFWARAPHSRTRPLLLERLYPYLARSPVAQRAMAQRFFGRDLARHHEPGFAHATRWHSTSSLMRLLGHDLRDRIEGLDVVGELRASLPPEFASWTPLAQDQYLELRTLLSGYLLSAQGDRMLMAHSVEGRFPFLDPEVMALANALPDAYKLRVLEEKYVLKRLGRALVPAAILARKKQPYRAPDALAFAADPEPEWIVDMLSESALKRSGVFEPRAAQALWRKCRSQRTTFSNADNMAITGVLSTQLLHHLFIRDAQRVTRMPQLGTLVDRTRHL